MTRYISNEHSFRNKMSAPTVTPGAKGENAVYLAFGLTIGLYLFRVYNPAIFNDVRGLVAAGALSASLIGAVFFYTKPDQVITWLLKRVTVYSYGDWMAQFIAFQRLHYKAWYVANREDWGTPEKERDLSISSVLSSSSLYDDIWRLKGGVYFIVGVAFLLLSLNIQELDWRVIALVLDISVFIPMIWGARRLPQRIASVASLKSLKDINTMVRSRAELRSRASIPEVWKPTLPENTELIETMVTELEKLLDAHDWIRFCYRFERFRADLISEIRDTSESAIDMALDLALRQFESRPSSDSLFSRERGVSFSVLVYNINRLPKDDWYRQLRSRLTSALGLITTKELKSIDKSIMETLIVWSQEEIAEDIPSLTLDILLELADEIEDDSVATVLYSELLQDDSIRFHSRIRSTHLKRLLDLGIEIPQSYIEEIILRRKQFGFDWYPRFRGRVGSIVRKLSKEYYNNFRFTIENFQSTKEGWRSAMKQVLEKPLSSSRWDRLKVFFRDRGIRRAFSEVMKSLLNDDDEAVRAGAKHYLESLNQSFPTKLGWIKDLISNDNS